MTAVLSLTERIDCSQTIAVSRRSTDLTEIGAARKALRVVIEHVARGNAELIVAEQLHNTFGVYGLGRRQRDTLIEEAANVAEALWNSTDDGYPVTAEDEALDADLTRYIHLLVPAVKR